MSHTIYAAKFEQTIIHQHVHLRRESKSHAPAHQSDKNHVSQLLTFTDMVGDLKKPHLESHASDPILPSNANCASVTYERVII
jgi:hypothetical protein